MTLLTSIEQKELHQTAHKRPQTRKNREIREIGNNQKMTVTQSKLKIRPWD